MKGRQKMSPPRSRATPPSANPSSRGWVHRELATQPLRRAGILPRMLAWVRPNSLPWRSVGRASFLCRRGDARRAVGCNLGGTAQDFRARPCRQSIATGDAPWSALSCCWAWPRNRGFRRTASSRRHRGRGDGRSWKARGRSSDTG